MIRAGNIRRRRQNITLSPKQKRIPDTQNLQDVDRYIGLETSTLTLALAENKVHSCWVLSHSVQKGIQLEPQYEACSQNKEKRFARDSYDPGAQDITKTENVGSAQKSQN